MLKSEFMGNKRLVKARRRSKRIKKQINYRTKTHKGGDNIISYSEERRKKRERKKKRKEIRDEFQKGNRVAR